MSLLSMAKVADMPIASWLHGLWDYYRGYTHTAVHAASTAALTAFGLLIFVNRLFVVLAIISYVGPPVLLYSIDSDAGRPSPASPSETGQEESATSSTMTSMNESRSDDGDADSDGVDSDTDSDSDDGDTDTDSDDGDTDSDGFDADTDGAVSDATG